MLPEKVSRTVPANGGPALSRNVYILSQWHHWLQGGCLHPKIHIVATRDLLTLFDQAFVRL